MNWKTPIEIAERLKKAFEALSSEKKDKLKKILSEGRNSVLRAQGKEADEAAGGPAPGEFSLAHDLLFEPKNLLEDLFREVEPVVKPNGDIVGTGKYEQLDPLWSLALIEWLELMAGIKKHAPFRVQPKPYKIVSIPDKLTMAVIGDWGTGKYGKEPCPPVQMADHLKKKPADYWIHLGDVYYGGTDEQEKENFIDLWPGKFETSLSLNSNHEMYDGANGYYGMIANFKQEYSYFALENSNWIVVGLDSAYYSDPDKLFLEGSFASEEQPAQIAYLTFMAEKAKKEHKGLILMSHHNPVDLKGESTNELWDQALGALGGAPPERVIWYYGHIHAGAVYKKRAPMELRLVGHGAVPWGLASELKGAGQVEWFEDRPNNVNSDYMVMNGYAVLTFDGANLKEEIFDQTGRKGWSAG